AAATAGLLARASIGTGEGPKDPAPAAITVAQRAPSRPGGGPEDDEESRVTIRGRVIAPDGKPVRDATIHVGYQERPWRPGEPVARTDAEGRLVIDPGEPARKQRPESPPFDWSRAELMAVAPGYGAGRARPIGAGKGEVELRLMPDDVPLLGRALDLQGRPIAGPTVTIESITDPPAGDLDALLEFGMIET